MASGLFATKSIDALRADAAGEHGLKRALGAMDLMLLGVGAIIGTGIFVLTGQAAADNAGPAVVLSFVAAGIASGFAGLCYSEMASMIPIAGSAYTYSYATMGELVAWIIGWDLDPRVHGRLGGGQRRLVGLCRGVRPRRPGHHVVADLDARAVRLRRGAADSFTPPARC